MKNLLFKAGVKNVLVREIVFQFPLLLTSIRRVGSVGLIFYDFKVTKSQKQINLLKFLSMTVANTVLIFHG